MIDADYHAARRTILGGGDPPPDLLDDCRRTVAMLVRTAGLPPHYSPYGVWSPEAVDEVFADWVAERLVGRGQMLAMLQRAPALRVFRRMAETSVRQHLVDKLKRSQAANLFDRVSRLLSEREDFVSTGTGGGAIWRQREGPAEPFPDDDRRLLSVAWSLGEFRVVRFDAEARKLSHVLEGEDLERFVRGMLSAGAMTAGTIVRALRLRFAIEQEAADTELADTLHGGEPALDAGLLLDELTTATLAELTERQAKVLIGLERKTPFRELAVQLGCSTGTISHEKGRIEELLARLGTDAPPVLKRVLDALFQENV